MKKIILTLPLAFAMAFSPVASFAGGVAMTFQETQSQDKTETDNPTEGNAAGREADRIARQVNKDGFFSVPGVVGSVLVAATIAVAIKAASDVVEGSFSTTPTSTTSTTTTTTTTTTSSTSTGTGN